MTTHLDDTKQLLKTTTSGTIATLDPSGYPYASYVEFAFSDTNRLFLLLSQLAVHTRNALRDDRVALSVVDPTADHILATQRATLQGHLVTLDDKPDWLRKLILETHPSAQDYIDFTDFSFFEFVIENVRYIKGFGEMSRFRWQLDDSEITFDTVEGKHEEQPS